MVEKDYQATDDEEGTVPTEHMVIQIHVKYLRQESKNAWEDDVFNIVALSESEQGTYF